MWKDSIFYAIDETRQQPSPKTSSLRLPPRRPPPEVQEAVQFLLAMAMYEAGEFELVSVAEVEGRWHYTFSGAGEVFSVVWPEMSKEVERKVREEVRACPAGKGYYETLWFAQGRRLWYNSHKR